MSPDPAWLAPAVALIKPFESCRLSSYPDPDTGGEPWTIGWGTTTYYDGQPVRQGDAISQQLADAFVAMRVATAEAVAALPGSTRGYVEEAAGLIEDELQRTLKVRITLIGAHCE
jgi:GH24 family phage-related lysozyme (muramidase)